MISPHIGMRMINMEIVSKEFPQVGKNYDNGTFCILLFKNKNLLILSFGVPDVSVNSLF